MAIEELIIRWADDYHLFTDVLVDFRLACGTACIDLVAVAIA
ncbi:MAG: hypothetical protein OEW58_05855 [Gammaproteobacteria bacterium]|nr:hypothetical protein [Gammaproteobacteria bacterium]